MCGSDFAVLEALLHKGRFPLTSLKESLVDERLDHSRS